LQASKKQKAQSQIVDDLPEGDIRPPPSNYPQDLSLQHCEDTENIDDDKFSIHPHDPTNFLKLSNALWLLIKHKLSDVDIDQADWLLREYSTELLRVRLRKY
jgi:hypothetical protein